MNCVIVGASGFIGRCLGIHCREHGHTVHGFDVAATQDAGFVVEASDVLSEPVVMPPDVDVVYYLAQSPHYREFPRRADHLFGVNVAGALKAAEAAIEGGAKKSMLS